MYLLRSNLPRILNGRYLKKKNLVYKEDINCCFFITKGISTGIPI